MNCAVCDTPDARPYMNGWYCPQHAPWARAGRPDPETLIDPSLTAAGLRGKTAQQPRTATNPAPLEALDQTPTLGA